MAGQKHGIVVLSDRKPLIDALRQGIKAAGISINDVAITESVHDCSKNLKDFETGVFFVDWEIGAEGARNACALIKKLEIQDDWRIYLIAQKPDEHIIAAGAEYGAHQVQTGDLTATKIKVTTERLLRDLREVTPLRKLMKSIAKAREGGKWAEAANILKKLYLQDRENRRVRFELAECYAQAQKWDKVHDTLEPCVNEEPPDVKAIHLFGKSLIKQNRMNQACEALKKAKLLNPYNVDRLVSLGQTLLNLDEITEARENFQQASDLAPDNEAALSGQGTCSLMEGEVNEALELLRNKINGRELASVFNTAAVLSMRQGRHDQGMSLYDSAGTALKDQVKILARVEYNRGIGYMKLKKPDLAKKAFQKASELDPEFENAKHNVKVLNKTAAAPPPTTDATAAEYESGPPDLSTFEFDTSFDEDDIFSTFDEKLR